MELKKAVFFLKKYFSYSRLFAFSALILALFPSCASLPTDREIIAKVNGESLTGADLMYMLEVSHRREDMSSAGGISISVYLDKLIRDVLIIQEARDMGMDTDPRIKKSVDNFILIESVGILRKKEILDKIPTKFTEDELLNAYNEAYQMYKIYLISSPSKETAKKALEDLNAGKDFGETAKTYSEFVSRSKDEEEEGPNYEWTGPLRSLSKTPNMKRALAEMKPGEMSGVIEEKGGSFYILKLIEKKNPPQADMEHIRGKMESLLRKDKEKERGDEYLRELRAKEDIEINSDILAQLDLNEPKNNEKFKNDERTIARVKNDTLKVRDYVSIIEKAKPGQKKEEFLDKWIDLRVVDNEALRRNYYEKDRDFRDRTRRYQDQLLKSSYINKIILPQVKMSGEDLERYYSENKEKFSKPDQYRYQQITIEDSGTAEEILKELKNGADFGWITKQKSINESERQNGGQLGLEAAVSMENMKALENLKPGELSPVIKIGSQYRILKLQDRKKGEIPALDQIKDDVKRMLFKEQYEKIMNDYISKLKEKADIRINEKALRTMEEMFKPKSDKKES